MIQAPEGYRLVEFSSWVWVETKADPLGQKHLVGEIAKPYNPQPKAWWEKRVTECIQFFNKTGVSAKIPN